MKAHARSLTREPSYPGDPVTITVTTAASRALGRGTDRYIEAVAICSGGTMATAVLYEDESTRPHGFRDEPFTQVTAARLALDHMVRGYREALTDTPCPMPAFAWMHTTCACNRETITRIKRQGAIRDLPLEQRAIPLLKG